MRLLETSGLTKRFGGLTVMNDLDFFIEEGEIKGFLGPNGAGKSTFFNLITLSLIHIWPWTAERHGGRTAARWPTLPRAAPD